jgi:hypothetical protein
MRKEPFISSLGYSFERGTGIKVAQEILEESMN